MMAKPQIMVCGSIAFDTIMTFGGHFREHILVESPDHISVSFLVPDMRKEFGGCAGNVAYNLALLGMSATVIATVGDDATTYLARLRDLAVDTQYIRTIPGTYTAQAFITSDSAGNQITAFHPGAMAFAEENAELNVSKTSIAIVAPDGKKGMQQHIRYFSNNKIPVILDPGQAITQFSGAELFAMIDQASYLALNAYEAQLLCELTGRKINQIAQQLKGLIVTHGAQGSVVYEAGVETAIAPVKAEAVVDPTGCGDAYRAGLLFGLAHGWSLLRGARLASCLGAIKISRQGGQNHFFTRNSLDEYYTSSFGEHIVWPS